MEWLLDYIKSLVYKALEHFLCKPLRWLKEKYVIIERKYITTPRIKKRIKKDLEYTYKEPDPLLKEALAIINEGKFVIIENHGCIPRRESPFGYDVPTTLYIYILSIRINQQKFLEYTNTKYRYTNMTFKEALEKAFTEAFRRYENLLNPDLKPCKTKVKIESK